MRVVRRPYSGPPNYGRWHPKWGFPPVIWRSGTVVADGSATAVRVRGLPVVGVLAGLTALACVTLGVAEAWRFSLMLAGRTQVLAGGPVHASDVLVSAAGFVAPVLGAVTAIAAVSVVLRLYPAAAARAGRAPARSPAELLARLIVPGWNLYGAGQVLMDIARMLRPTEPGRRRGAVVVSAWWVAWAVNGLLALATLICAFGRGNQIVADTVQLHVAVDLVAAVVAGLSVAVTRSFERALGGGRSRRYDGWVVQRPDSTPRNRRSMRGAPPADAVSGAGSGPDAGSGPPGADVAGTGVADAGVAERSATPGTAALSRA